MAAVSSSHERTARVWLSVVRDVSRSGCSVGSEMSSSIAMMHLQGALVCSSFAARTESHNVQKDELIGSTETAMRWLKGWTLNV